MRSKSLALGLSALMLVVACSGGSDESAKPTPTPTPTTASPTPSPTPAPTDPLTGSSAVATGSLVAVKIDNAPLARKFHAGLGRAAVVYEELVEGGSTRFLAVYESDVAGSGEVGPIRSIRESDIELVRMFGNIPVAYSGANDGVKAIVRTSARKKYLVDASYDAIPSAYRLGAVRRDARNFFAGPTTLAKLKPGSRPRDIGFRFGPVGLTGVPATSAIAAFSGTTRVQLSYAAATNTWQVSQNGQRMAGVAPSNIILQRVTVRKSRFRDTNGFPTPYTKSTGAGTVTVLRDGQRFAGTWKRAGFGATRFLDATGTDIRLRPGNTWVLLIPTAGSVTFS